MDKAAKDKGAVRWQELGELNRDSKPWGIETRATDRGEKIPVYSSFTLGETYTGKWISGALPHLKSISFDIVGHNGIPDNADHHLNHVDLIDLQSGEVLKVAYPPRSDTGKRIDWDLSPYASRKLGLSVVDNDKNTSYAWIAVGGFSIDSLNPEGLARSWERVVKVCDSIGGLKSEQSIGSVFSTEGIDVGWKVQLALLYENQRLNLPLHLANFAWKRGWHHESERAFHASGVEHANKEVVADDLKVVVQALSRLCSANDRKQLVSLLSSHASWHPLLLAAIQKGWLGYESLVVLEDAWWSGNQQSETVAALRKFKPNPSTIDATKNEAFTLKQTQIMKMVGDASRGQLLFKQHCGLCHQIGGQGAVLDHN